MDHNEVEINKMEGKPKDRNAKSTKTKKSQGEKLSKSTLRNNESSKWKMHDNKKVIKIKRKRTKSQN